MILIRVGDTRINSNTYWPALTPASQKEGILDVCCVRYPWLLVLKVIDTRKIAVGSELQS